MTKPPPLTVGALKKGLARFDDNQPVQVWLPGTRVQLEQVFEFTDAKYTGHSSGAVLIEGRVISGGFE